MLEDALELLNSDEKPFQAEEKQQKKPDKNNLWNKNDFVPKKIRLEDLKREGKSYSILYSYDHTVVPEDQVETLSKLALTFSSLDYIFRSMAGSKDPIQNAILKEEKVKSEVYLPWKSFNPDIAKPYLLYPTEEAYTIACNYHKVFNSLPPTARAILATTIHLLLGKDLKNPLSLCLIYSECGTETLKGKDIDYKKLGHLGFVIRVCADANIPVYNLRSSDGLTRLIEFLKKAKDKS